MKMRLEPIFSLLLLVIYGWQCQSESSTICYDWQQMVTPLSSFSTYPKIGECNRGNTTHGLSDTPSGDDYPLLRVTRNVRYLLYDAKIGEGFNLQKEVIFRTAMTVASLNEKSTAICREDGSDQLCSLWVLVLPPWCQLAHWRHNGSRQDGRKRNLRWDLFFEGSIMRSMIPSIEYEDFHIYRNKGSHEIDFLAYLKFSHDRNLVWNRTEEISTCTNGYYNKPRLDPLCSFDKPCTHPFQADYSGFCDTLKSREMWCYEMWWLNGPNAASAIWESTLKDPSLQTFLIKNADSFLVPWPSELQEVGIVEALYPSKYVRSIGDKFIADKLLRNGGYISTHIRRGDFSRRPSASFEWMAGRLAYLMKQYNVSSVFACTDGGENERQLLSRLVKQHGPYTVVFYEEDLGHPGLNAIVEQWIASRAVYFVGTMESRYTSAIRWERIFMGRSFATTGDNYCIPEAGKEPPVETACYSVPSHAPTEITFKSEIRRAYFAE